MKITKCQVNHLSNPIGYEMEKPVFSWIVEEAKGKAQREARIIIYHDGKIAADTGWGELDSLAQPVAFSLLPRTRYTWTVKVRTDAGEECESEEQFFETAKQDEPWRGQWIGCDENETRHPLFEKDIAARPEVASARLYLCGLGLYELRFDGEKLGNEYLTPYCSDYDLWCQYQTWDLTEEVRRGGTLGVLLGNGWYRGRLGFDADPHPAFGEHYSLIAEIRLCFADGHEEVIGSDESWRVQRSTITFSNIYDGEIRDDTLPELPAEAAIPMEAPRGRLAARLSLPVTAHEEFKVREVLHTPAGETVLDIGQNMAGSFRLWVREPRGTEIRLQFGELLQNGNFYRDNLRTAKAEYRYVSDGTEKLIEPRFTFYGFRYVKVEGAVHFVPEDFTAFALYSDMPMRGTIETGSPLVNKLLENTRWGMKSNFLDVPTDCPQRDERLGWTGDAQVFSTAACYLADPAAFYRKYLRDMELEQQSFGGMVPNFVPNVGRKAETSGIWGDAATIIPWNLYLYSGDLTLLAEQYPGMCAWVDYITRVDGDDHGWRRQFHFGDWLALDAPWEKNGVRGATDEAFLGDVFYRKSALNCARAARLLGEEEDESRYEALAEKILAGIREEYYAPNGRCCIPTQTAALLTIDEGLADSKKGLEMLSLLLERSEGKLTTGFVGTPMLCRVLGENGLEAKAFDLLLNEDYPGWLHEVKLGATTVWERWNSLNEDGSISSTGMNSMNHYAYGSIVEWLFGGVAGLRPCEEAPGFRRAVIRPLLDRRLGHVRMEYPSAAGLYRVSWEIMGKREVQIDVSVPFGCSARLILPMSGESPVELDSGDYSFTYDAKQSLVAGLSTHVPISVLLADPGSAKVLRTFLPEADRMPPSMQANSLRTLAVKMNGRIGEELLERIDTALGEL